MSEDNSLRVDTTPDPDLKVESAGPLKIPTYDIDPADQHIADQILAMDPLRDLPSPHRGLEFAKPPEMVLTALPPDMRETVEKKLAIVPASKRAESEREFVRAALEERSREVRAISGVGDGALPLHAKMSEQAIEVRHLARRFNDISAQLDEVDRVEMRPGPNGERVPVTVFAAEGATRDRLMREQDEINRHIKSIYGFEGARQLQKALKESIELVKARNAALAEDDEVRRGAEEKVRRDRIEKRIAIRARMIDPDLTS